MVGMATLATLPLLFGASDDPAVEAYLARLDALARQIYDEEKRRVEERASFVQ